MSIDPETGEPLKPGHLTRRELREWLGRSRRRWESWARGPKPAGGFVMTQSVGWTRTRRDNA